MLEVRVTREFAVPADLVWQWIRDFNGLPGWVPGIRAFRSSGPAGNLGAAKATPTPAPPPPQPEAYLWQCRRCTAPPLTE